MVLRKIDAMHKLFGTTPGKRCGDCPHLRTYQHGQRRWFKCVVYGTSASIATDWVKKWEACGLFDKPVPKGYRQIIRTLTNDPKKILPVEGQIDMFGGVTNDRQ